MMKFRKTILLINDDDDDDVVDLIEAALKDGWHVEGVFPLEWEEWTDKIDEEGSKTWGHVTKAVVTLTKDDDAFTPSPPPDTNIVRVAGSRTIKALRRPDGTLEPLRKEKKWWKPW